MKYKAHIIPLFFISILIAATPNVLSAQFTLNTENMGLGGGGTAYVTGYEAIHINPANLYFQEKPYNVQYSFLQSSIYFDSMLPISDNLKRLNRFSDVQRFLGYPLPIRTLNDDQREQLIKRSFNKNQSSAEFRNRGDIYWFGIKWVKSKRSYAIALRTRFANRYKIGRGFFTNSPLEKNNNFIREHSLSHSSHALHEISFGFAESSTFLNGLSSRLSEFTFGIAPKVVLAGSYLNIKYDNRFTLDNGSGLWTSEQLYHQRTTAEFTESAKQLTNPGGITDLSLREPEIWNALKPEGLGVGIDLGITYLFSLGDDFTTINEKGTPTKKSLRVSLSLTDVGMTFYKDDVRLVQSEKDSIQRSQSPDVSEFLYDGSADEHYRFLSQFSEFNNLSFNVVEQTNFGVLLPTSLQAGAVFQYNRIKATGDISYSIVKNAFNPTGVVGYVGLELRPLRFLPLRAGTRLAPNLPGYYSFGAAIETSIFELSAGILLKSTSGGVSGEILGITTIGFKFYANNRD